MEYNLTWSAAKRSAAKLMEQFGMDTTNLFELNVIALSFMEGTSYALLHQKKEEKDR